MNTRLRHYSMEFYHELADELLIADAGKLKEICIEYQNRMNLQNEADFVERIKQYLEMNKKISDKEFILNQRIIAGNAQFTGIAAGRGVGFTTGLLLLREGLGMRETPIRPHSWH